MSTVKIKTEPTATATTAVTVDVQVKLEPSLSTADIKLEQHTSDIDTKVESDSDTDIKSEDDSDIKLENDDDNDTGQIIEAPKNQRRFFCKHPGCSRNFNSPSHLRRHQHDHNLQAEINTLGKVYTLTRQSINDRWLCPQPDCISAAKTVDSIYKHMRRAHDTSMKQQNQQQHQHKSPAQLTLHKLYFIDVDHFYVNGVRCGYHNTIGVFICHECRLVPECLQTHLQQKHGYTEKSIDSAFLPESARITGSDPNINQHTNSSYLKAAIRQPHWQHHQDIVQGWMCLKPDCGYCCSTTQSKTLHKKTTHHGEKLQTVPALVLRLVYAKTQALYFLITPINQVSDAFTASTSRVDQHRLDYHHNGLNTQDENGDDVNQDGNIEESNQRKRFICDYPNCRRLFNSTTRLGEHRREHKLEVVINVSGNAFTLSRQSLEDQWPCPAPNCESTCKTVRGTRLHIHNTHSILMKQKRANMEDDDKQQQQIIKRTKRNVYYIKVDDFYVNGTKCGYHTTTGLFMCHECRLVPECLLTHLQQKHGYDEKSIDNAILPESARINGSNPNINQHTSNSHLSSVLREPSQHYHPNIVQGWLCITSNCGYCSSTKESRDRHQRMDHKGKLQSTVPALVLRLIYSKTQASSFLITRLDTTTISSSVEPSISTSQCNSECDDAEDDGDELVLSDYSDDDDIH